MPWINPSTRAAGYKVTAATWNQDVVENTRFLAKPPSVRLRRVAGVQSIPDNVWTAISFDTEDWDTDLMWSSTAPTKVFARKAGKYSFDITAVFAGSTGGVERLAGLRKNSTGTGEPTDGYASQRDSAGAAIVVAVAVSGSVALSSGQFAEVVMAHDNSTNINTSIARGGSFFSMRWESS